MGKLKIENLSNSNIDLETKFGLIASKGFDFQKVCLINEILKCRDDYVYGFVEKIDDLVLVKVNEISGCVEWIKVIQVKGKYILNENIIDIKESKTKIFINKFLNNINRKMIEYSGLEIFGSYTFSGILKYYNNTFKSGIKIIDLINQYGNNFGFKTSDNFKLINELTTFDYHELNGNNFSSILINSLDNLSKYPSVIKSHELIITMLMGAISVINDKVLIKSKNIENDYEGFTWSNIKDYILKIQGGVETNYKMINDLLQIEKYRFLDDYSSNDFSIMLRKLEIYVVEFKLNINTLYDKIFNKIIENILETRDEIYYEIFKTDIYEELDKYKKLWLYLEALVILRSD